MKPYGQVLRVYLNRPLLCWSGILLLPVALFAVAVRGYWDPRTGVMAMILLVVIMGVQVAGYVGVTAIQLTWNDWARVTPGMKGAHLPVVIGLLLGLFLFVVGTAVIARQNVMGTAALAGEVMAVGLWLITMRKWWMIPVGLYFVILGTQLGGFMPGDNTRLSGLMLAGSAALIALWLWKLFVLGGEPLNFDFDVFAHVDSRLYDFVRRVIEVGPMWVISRRQWRRGSMVWRLSRWWPAAGDGWMLLGLLVPVYFVALMRTEKLNEAYFIVSERFSWAASAMTVMTGVPLLLGVTMVMSRGSVMAMEAVWPVKRRAMMAETLAIIVIEVAAMWVLAVIPLLILAVRGVSHELDERTTLLCIVESGALVAMVLGVLVWLERTPMEIRGPLVVLGAAAVGLGYGMWVGTMPDVVAVVGSVVTVALALVIWRDVVKVWLRADLTRRPGEGKVMNV